MQCFPIDSISSSLELGQIPGMLLGTGAGFSIRCPDGRQSTNRMEVDIDGTADERMASVKGFEDVFPYGTLEEQKEYIRLFVDGIELIEWRDNDGSGKLKSKAGGEDNASTTPAEEED